MFTFFNKKKITMDVEVLFHTDSNLYGSHGEIVVTNKDHNYHNKVIRFVFKGMVNPPALTPQVLEYLFKRAEEAGYIPFEVMRYGNSVNLTNVATAQICDDKNKNEVLQASVRRRQYLQAMQDGYPYTFERWKKEMETNECKQVLITGDGNY